MKVIVENSYQLASDIENNNVVESNKESIWDSICWFYPPHIHWSLSWYLTVRGAENFHIYIWILKDIAWAQSWYYAGWFFGSFAMIWSLYLLSHAMHLRNWHEIWNTAAQFFW